MPDISMCANMMCPLQMQCYNHASSGTIPNSSWQSYALYEYKDGRCEHFTPKLPSAVVIPPGTKKLLKKKS